MFRYFIFSLLSLVCMTLVTGCETMDATTVDTKGFREISAKTKSTDVTELDVGDNLEVSVEVDGRMEYQAHRAVVNHLGFVTLPLVGDVHVGGVGLNVARMTITKRYGAYYVSTPVVMVSLVGADGSTEWGQVSVMGRVGNPGPVQLSSGAGMRLSAAIQAAGGFAPSAKTSEIQVTRLDSDGKKLRVKVDFNEIGKSGNADSDLVLKAGDIVFVPERVF